MKTYIHKTCCLNSNIASARKVGKMSGVGCHPFQPSSSARVWLFLRNDVAVP